jgi:putative autoinducer-2 (AI-2) aldolase
MLAIDHGYFLGPTEKLENPGKIIKPLLPYADSLMLTRGILRTSLNPSATIPIVLRVSGGSSVIGENLSNECLTTCIEDALKLNVSCVALSIFVGSKYEHRTLKNLAKLVDECERFGVPALAVTAVGKEMTRDYRYLALSCRIAAEIGAHLVKTYYCENFHKSLKVVLFL